MKHEAERRNQQALASFTDDSIPNLSSIVALAEADGRRVLLTGDARGDKVLAGLEMTGLLAPGGTLSLDLLKVPHHGSDRNLATIFFQRLPARHYVFSGDGEHGNPERATLEMLLEARGMDDYVIHLTYPVAEIDVGREEDWRKEQAREKARHAKNPNVRVRPDWSPAENSLGALFAAHPDFAAKVRVVEPDRPHVIDLADPLGF